MGYTTDFEGSVSVTPPLNLYEVTYLCKFNETRRMQRDRGPYFVDGSGDFGQGQDEDIRNYNQAPPDQPGLWCKWMPAADGTAIEWDGAEKFYDSAEWMAYLIDTFLKAGATVQAELAEPVEGRDYPEAFAHFTFDHVVDGTIEAQGEEADDRWRLVVTANEVTTQRAHFVWSDED